MTRTSIRRTGGASEREEGPAEATFERALDASPDGILVLDEGGRVLWANRAAAELLGQPADVLIGERPALPEGDDGDAARADDDDVTVVELGTGEDARVVEVRAADTEWEGEPARVLALREVTARLRAEARERALAVEQTRRHAAEERAARASFRSTVSAALLKSLALGINLHELTRALCSSGFSDWCAVDLLEDGAIVRRSATIEVPELRCEDRDCLHSPDPVVTPITTDEARRLAARLGGDWSGGAIACVPVRRQDEPVGLLMFARRERSFDAEDLDMTLDVASRVALSIDHARLYEEAQRAGHAKSQFLAVMSHELRTPLNAVIGYTDLLLLGIAGPMSTKQRDILSKVQTSSRHLIALVEEILIYTRMERGQEALALEEMSVGELVAETMDVIAPMARGSGLDFRTSIDNAAQRITTDPQKVRQVLTNLLTNAIKYTEHGYVALRTCADPNGVRFDVVDSGIGMTQEHIAHIYDPFWQVEPTNTRRHGGTGLGLTVAMQLTRMLGGRLSVQSEPGTGSTFTLRLPHEPPRPQTT